MRVWGYILAAALLAGAFLAGCWTRCRTSELTVRRDTVILHDTLTVSVPAPSATEVVRRDTCWLVRCDTVWRADTLRIPVAVPVERRVYATADYRAVVEGYRPSLVSMELYRQTQVVTETPAARPRRWGVGIQAGWGFAPRTGRLEPYIGIGIQYSIWQW